MHLSVGFSHLHALFNAVDQHATAYPLLDFILFSQKQVITLKQTIELHEIPYKINRHVHVFSTSDNIKKNIE